MAKKRQNNTQIDDNTNTRTGHNLEFKNVLTGSTDVFKKNRFERLLIEFVDWSTKNNNLSLPKFLQKHGMPRRTYYDYLEYWPDLKYLHNEAMIYLGCGREEGATLKKYDAGLQLQQLYKYDPDWFVEINRYNDERKKEIAKASKESSTAPTHITVEMKSFDDQSGNEDKTE